ncbi:MAG: hypothetical protein ACYC7E_03915 [Armatimonadota bacterium]
MRRFFLFCALLVLAAGAWGQEATFGLIIGAVKFDSGEPRPGVAVSIVIEATPKPITYALTTNARGEFSGVVRIGKAKVTVEGITKEATITDNPDGTRVEFVTELTGVVLEIVHPDGSQVSGHPRGRCWSPNNVSDVNPRNLTPTKYWFQDVPPTATEFAVRFDRGYIPVIQRWKLEGQEKRRAIKMVIPKPVHVDLVVVAENGEPVAQTQLRGTLDYRTPGGDDGWSPGATTDANSRINTSTDANGGATLMLPAGQYTLRLRSEQVLGAPAPLTVPEGKESVAVRYIMKAIKPRNVTQIVFTAKKKPAAGAKVSAVYGNGNTLVHREAVADAAGKVLWENLPPVKTIVWGENVPAGVMNGDETDITTPLPAPAVPDKNRNYSSMQVTVENVPADAAKIVAAYSNSRDTNTSTTSGTDRSIWIHSLLAGQPFSVLVMADGTPPRYAYVDLYYPYFDEPNNSAAMKLALADGTLLKYSFTKADGASIPAVSRVGVVAIKPTRPIPGLATNQVFKEIGLLSPRAEGGGKYRVVLPSPGQYRLLVDMFDESAPPLPVLDVTTKEGVNEITIKLPAPLATVPGGTGLHWLTQTAPASPRRMTVAATADMMPVFGPREELICAWYRSAPNRLAVVRPDAAGFSIQELSLRTVTVRGTDAEGKPSPNSFRLHPLFPNWKGGNYMPLVDRPNDTEVTETMVGAAGLEANLWNTTYLVSSYSPGPYISLAVPAGASEVAVKLPPQGQPGPARMPSTSVRFQFPKTEIPKSGNYGQPSHITIVYDVPTPNWSETRIYAGNLNQQGGYHLTVPRKATKASFYFPGVGASLDVPLPDLANANPDNPITVTVPAWGDGLIASGTIVRATGEAWAKKRYLITASQSSNRYGRFELYLQTDEAGKFAIKGLMPGIYYLYPRPQDEAYDEVNGWVLDVTKTSVKDATLQFQDGGLRISVNSMGQGIQGAWWIPDTGAVAPLPSMYNRVLVHPALTGAGRFWAYSNDGSGLLERMTLPNSANIQLNSAGYGGKGFSSPLGMHLPLDANGILPTRVILVGQGKMAGIAVEFANLRWFPSVMLNRTVAQIDAVPAGKWLVRIELGENIIERTVDIGERGGSLVVTD